MLLDIVNNEYLTLEDLMGRRVIGEKVPLDQERYENALQLLQEDPYLGDEAREQMMTALTQGFLSGVEI